MTDSNLSRRSFLKSSTIAATAAAALPLAAAPIAAELLTVEAASVVATPVPAQRAWRWMLSTDGGTLFSGDYASYEEAHADALRHHEPVVIAECLEEDFDLVVDGERIIQLLEDRNDDRIGEGDFLWHASDIEIEDLGKRVSAAIAAWVAAHGIDTTAGMFAGTRNSQKVAGPVALDAARYALEILDDKIASPDLFESDRQRLIGRRADVAAELAECERLAESALHNVGEPA